MMSETKRDCLGLQVRFATVLRGVAVLVTTSDAWAKNLSANSTVLQGNTKVPLVMPIYDRLGFKYNVNAWQTLPVVFTNFNVPVFCRSPYDSTSVSPLGRLVAMNASISMAGVSCYNPGNTTFKYTLPGRGQNIGKTPRSGKTSPYY